MKQLIQAFGKLTGIHFASDNHVIPVLRWERYHRVKGPGFFWIMPIIERALPPVKTSLYVGNFTFEDVLSRNNVPFRVEVTILFTFNPTTALKSAAAMLVRGGDELLQRIVKDYTNQGLRRLASRYEASELGSEAAMSCIERNLTGLLTAEMRSLGIVPLRAGGVLIKETVAPTEFKQAILDARRLEAILLALNSFPTPGLVEQAIQAGFVTGLERLESNLTLLSTLSPLEAVHPPYGLNGYPLPIRDWDNVRGGH